MQVVTMMKNALYLILRILMIIIFIIISMKAILIKESNQKVTIGLNLILGNQIEFICIHIILDQIVIQSHHGITQNLG